MKKILLLSVQLVILLIAAELSASYYISDMVERKFRKWNSFMSDNSMTTSEIISYDKGLFRSEVVTCTKSKLAGMEKAIQIKHTILNGPIIFTARKEDPFELQLAIIESQPIEQLSSIDIPFVVRTVFNYQGDIESWIEGAAFNVKHDLIAFSSQPWKSYFKINKDLVELKGNITFPEIAASLMGMEFSIKNIEINYAQKQSQFGNWLGNVAFAFDELNDKKMQAKIIGLKLSEGSALLEETINIAWSFDFVKAIFANTEYGPLQVRLSAQNIDPEALHEFSRFQSFSPERQQEIYRKILVKKPRFIIEHANFIVPKGAIHLEAEFTLGGNNITVPIQADVLEKTINGHFYVILPKELVRLALAMGLQSQMAKDPEYAKMDFNQKKEAMDKQIDLKIQRLKESGILNENDKVYEIKISIVDGKSIANGKEITKSSVLNLPNDPSTTNAPMNASPAN